MTDQSKEKEIINSPIQRHRFKDTVNRLPTDIYKEIENHLKKMKMLTVLEKPNVISDFKLTNA